MLSGLPFKLMFFFMMFFGTMFSISSQHWLGLWAGLELNLIGFLPLLVYEKTSWESEAAVKYFIVQALGSSLLILGSLLNYSSSFSWEFFCWFENSFISLTLIMSGLMLKVGVAPFHLWVPSVMSSLPWSSCMFLATWQKIAPMSLIYSLITSMNMSLVLWVYLILGGISSLIGGIGGMNQTQMRALLAYSSIGHMGWLIVSIICGSFFFVIYLITYMTISLFLFFSMWKENLSSYFSFSNSKQLKFTKNNVLIIMLSLGGLPPMLGFVSKFLVIMGANYSFMLITLVFLILGSLMSLYYYLVLFFNLFNIKMYQLVFASFKSELSLWSQIGNLFNILGGLMMLNLIFLFLYALIVFY